MRIAYAYTANGRRTRTTWARGVWKENAYNERNLVGGVTYSDAATPSVAYAYADSGRVASAALSDGTAYAYGYDDRLLNTNETVSIGQELFSLVRTFDAFRRNEATAVVVTNVQHAAKVRHYDSEDRVCGYSLTNAAGRSVSVAMAYDGSYLTNMAYSLPNDNTLSVALTRKASRREFVSRRDYSFNGQSAYWYATDYDLLGRPTNATDSVSLSRGWRYNSRSELAAATLGTNLYGYAYDTIGNRQWSAANSATNEYSANSLNQYTMVERTATGAPPAGLYYDADGNLEWDDSFVYSYDAENRLTMVSPVYETNGVVRVMNKYDHLNRRVRKTVQRLSVTVAPAPSPPIETPVWNTVETHVFVWDTNNIVLEKVDFANGTTRMFEYFWGLDKSGTEQGAGGVGGLLAMSVDGVFYIPCYDHNGNIVLYVSETGSIAAQYTYDPYGNIIESSGPLADVFSFGFSTKYHDREIGMIGYQQRFYRPDLGRWLNRDPIEEEGGENLYAFCVNAPIFNFDFMGLTKVSISMGTSVEESKMGERLFLNITVTVDEKPSGGGFLNFIQLKNPGGHGWSVDCQQTLGPYYYSLIELPNFTTNNKQGKPVLTLKDAPGGCMVEPTSFFVAIVEVNETCYKDSRGRYFKKCYDKVKVIATRAWTYNPNTDNPYDYKNKEGDHSVISVLRRLINNSTWRTNLCPNTQVEIE